MTPRRPLKGIVDFTERFSRWPLCFVLGGLVAMAGLIGWVWGGVWIGLALILFVLGDGVMLAALPRFARSYGPPQLPLLALTLLRLLLAIGGSTWVARPWAPLFCGAVRPCCLCWRPMRVGLSRHVWT